MGLAEELNEAVLVPSKGSCNTCWYLKSAPIEDRVAVDTFLENNKSYKALSQILKNNGFNLPDHSLRRHHENGHTLA
jgi:hypothetical protein